MSELSLNQITFLIDTLKSEKGLGEFDFEDSKMMWRQLEKITLCEKRLLHSLIISSQTKKLIEALNRFRIKRKQIKLI